MGQQKEKFYSDKAEELITQGYCVLKNQFAASLVENCRLSFLPAFNEYLKNNGHSPNRGLQRHFLPMPFEPPCFAPEFFFDPDVLHILYKIMGDKIVADQWGCDAPLPGSDYQAVHVDYQRPLFHEVPHKKLPCYMMVLNFGLTTIMHADGPIELAPGTHTMQREKALHDVENATIKLHAVCLDIGDVLIRHPWVLHRGTPNKSLNPRLLVSIRYVRDWYYDESREVNPIPAFVWDSLSKEQKKMLRFPRSNAKI